jgi:hypothetical protein
VQGVVEVIVAGGGPRGNVMVEALDGRGITVQALTRMRAGQNALFSYHNQAGRFRFATKCVSVKDDLATFALPHRIDTIQLFQGTQQRAAVRLDATLPAQWRFALGGKGQGEFTRASITDISRTGASLIVDRELKKGTFVEIKVSISSSASPLALLGEVMRASKIETSGKVSLGLRFNGVTPEEDRAIMEFINKRQAERRSRGLA